MTTEQPSEEAQGGAQKEKEERRDEHLIAVSAGDESVAKLQLAARWAERFGSRNEDSMLSMLKRFRLAYEYLDAITHGIEPPGEEGGGRRESPVALTPEQLRDRR